MPELAARVFDAYLCVTEYVLHTGGPYTRLAEFALQLRDHAHAVGARRGGRRSARPSSARSS